MCYPVMRSEYLDLTKPNQAAVQSLKHKIDNDTMYYMISCKFSEFPFELCRKRAFNRAKKALFWSRAKILPSGYHAQLDSCAGPFLGVVQK